MLEGSTTLELEESAGLVVLEGSTTLELEGPAGLVVLGGTAESVELETGFKLVSVLVPTVDSDETLVTLPVELESTAGPVELALVRVEEVIKDEELVEGRRMQMLRVEAMTAGTRSTKLAPNTPAFTIVGLRLFLGSFVAHLYSRSRRLHIAHTCMHCNAMHSDLYRLLGRLGHLSKYKLTCVETCSSGVRHGMSSHQYRVRRAVLPFDVASMVHGAYSFLERMAFARSCLLTGAKTHTVDS